MLRTAKNLHRFSSLGKNSLLGDSSRLFSSRTREGVSSSNLSNLGRRTTTTSSLFVKTHQTHSLPSLSSFSTERGIGLFKSRTPEQDAVVRKELDLLKSVKELLLELGAVKEDVDLVVKSVSQLEDLFLLVVVGEFNSGKSSFLNALLGKRLLKEGLTPTTSRINLLKFGESFRTESDGLEREIVTVPVDWLKEISLVDTPGTNAVVKGHQQITEHFIPHSDLVLFVTSVDRAFSESERVFLSLIRQWKKKIVVILSKVDLLESDSQLSELVLYVRKNFQEHMGLDPLIIPISSRLALKAKLESPDSLPSNSNWKKSNFETLENYVHKTLNVAEQTKLKLENPLGIAEHMLRKYGEEIEARSRLLREDISSLQEIQQSIEEFKKEMSQQMSLQNERLDNVLLKMGQRGERFLDEKISITQIFELLREDQFRKQFEKDVVGESSIEIERHIGSIADWILSKSSKQWNFVVDFLQRRVLSKNPRLLHDLSLTFDYNRSAILANVTNSVQSVVLSYDRQAEANRLSSQVKNAILTTTLMEVGALGLGGLISASLLDLSGLLGVGALAATGLAILPYKRSVLKAQFEEQINSLRQRLTSSLSSHLTQELESSVRRIEEAIEPYSKFVKVEKARLEKTTQTFQELEKQFTSLRQDIQNSFKSQ